MNHKQVYRLYRCEGFRHRKRKRLAGVARGTAVSASEWVDQRWSMDIVAYALKVTINSSRLMEDFAKQYSQLPEPFVGAFRSHYIPE